MIVTKSTVFVSRIEKHPNAAMGVVVEASNGSSDGPPLARFRMPNDLQNQVRIGQRLTMTIEEEA